MGYFKEKLFGVFASSVRIERRGPSANIFKFQLVNLAGEIYGQSCHEKNDACHCRQNKKLSRSFE